MINACCYSQMHLLTPGSKSCLNYGVINFTVLLIQKRQGKKDIECLPCNHLNMNLYSTVKLMS